MPPYQFTTYAVRGRAKVIITVYRPGLEAWAQQRADERASMLNPEPLVRPRVYALVAEEEEE